MNKGGTNGTVTKIATTGTGSTVTVSYPGDPNATPAVPPYAEDYDVADPYLRRFEDAKPPRPKVEVEVVPATGVVTGVAAHA